MSTSHVFLEGHRIRVEISSSKFPQYMRNLNTGGNNVDETERNGFTLIGHEKQVLPGSVAHYIAISRERKLALVGVKGTSGLEELITDCVGGIVTHALEGPFIQGSPREVRCHEGIALAATRLAEDLGVIVQALLLPAGYRLLITGHSLGAGVAALVAVILRSRIPRLRDDEDGVIRVLAFGSPPVLDHDAALACAGFVSSIVNNSDVIPRMSLSNLVVMSRMLQAVHDKMAEKGVSPQDLKSTAALMQWLARGTDGEMIMSVDEVRAGLNQVLAEVELTDPDHLYVPGKVIHMYDLWGSSGDEREAEGSVDEQAVSGESTADDGSGRRRAAERVYVGDGTSSELRHIEMEARLLSDHLPAAYRDSIQVLLSPAKTG
jgi:hypothetical protein